MNSDMCFAYMPVDALNVTLVKNVPLSVSSTLSDGSDIVGCVYDTFEKCGSINYKIKGLEGLDKIISLPELKDKLSRVQYVPCKMSVDFEGIEVVLSDRYITYNREKELLWFVLNYTYFKEEDGKVFSANISRPTNRYDLVFDEFSNETRSYVSHYALKKPDIRITSDDMKMRVLEGVKYRDTYGSLISFAGDIHYLCINELKFDAYSGTIDGVLSLIHIDKNGTFQQSSYDLNLFDISVITRLTLTKLQ